MSSQTAESDSQEYILRDYQYLLGWSNAYALIFILLSILYTPLHDKINLKIASIKNHTIKIRLPILITLKELFLPFLAKSIRWKLKEIHRQTKGQQMH